MQKKGSPAEQGRDPVWGSRRLAWRPLLQETLPWGTPALGDASLHREAPPSPAVSQMEMLKERHCFR